MRVVQPSSRAKRSPHGAMAPSEIDKSVFGTTRSGSTSSFEPRPLQSTHMTSALFAIGSLALFAFDGNEQGSAASPQGRFDRIRQARAVGRIERQTVDDDLN